MKKKSKEEKKKKRKKRKRKKRRRRRSRRRRRRRAYFTCSSTFHFNPSTVVPTICAQVHKILEQALPSPYTHP